MIKWCRNTTGSNAAQPITIKDQDSQLCNFNFKTTTTIGVNCQLTFYISLPCCPTSQQQTAGVAYTHPTTVASYTVHQAPVAAHTVAAAYAPSAATVAVARPAPVSVAAATAAAYGGYQPAHTAADYGYPQRQQDVPPPPPPVTSQNYQVRHKFFFLSRHLHGPDQM